MNNYQIYLSVDDVERTEKWYGYDEKGAIAQCFLSNAQAGARKIEVLSIYFLETI